MSLLNIFNISGSGMSAQNIRMTTTASNLSNSETIGKSEKDTYRARLPVFEAVHNDAQKIFDKDSHVAVKVTEIIESEAPLRKLFQPDHKYADENGYIYMSNVNLMEEMSNMISASKSYQMNAQMLKSAKQMMYRTLQIGQ